MRKYKFFSYFLTFALIFISITACRAGVKQHNDEIHLNDPLIRENVGYYERDNNIHDDLIDAYLAGEEVNTTELGDGNIKIAVEDGGYILIPVENNLDRLEKFAKNEELISELTTDTNSVRCNGVKIKPGFSVSNTVCASKYQSMRHDFKIHRNHHMHIDNTDTDKSETTELQIEPSVGISLTFEIPTDRCGTIYAREIYNEYTFSRTKDGETTTSELEESLGYLFYFIVH